MSQPTLVVNIRLDAFDQYIGRAGKGQSGTFGNPFRPQSHGSRGNAIDAFEEYFLRRVAVDPKFRQLVLALRGRRLGCFCAPKGGITAADRPWRCHGQVIAAWLDSQPEGDQG